MAVRGFEVIRSYMARDIQLPKRKTIASAGYDIEAGEKTVLKAQKVSLIPTGLKAYMQKDEYLGIHIRSGFSIKNMVTLINSQGIIDADYYNNVDNEGHIMLAVFNHNEEDVMIEKGMRIAQGVFYKYLTTDDDCVHESAIRQGGMGSTGEK
ncbi:dUTP diphosphatase [Anaerosinus massiliensis]|uniref:dUTP diphosphatase n=1 Tax=Massilibacillus massiliensis TaxID=1806837 RepID=UPI000A8AF2D6|nr:dUTP diphosphatase [Massilibacillus massiliensis]